MADAPRGVTATSQTVYHWWSMTKIPTAMAVLQLADRGHVELDGAVVDYLPWFDVGTHRTLAQESRSATS